MGNPKYIYMGGTISPAPEHREWRQPTHAKLYSHGITGLDPMRGKDWDAVTPDGLRSNIPGQLFCARDKADIKRSSVVLLHFPIEIPRQSIGTWAELGFAIAYDKPLVVSSPLGYVFNHPFIVKWADACEVHLQDALDRVIWLAT